MDYFQVNPLSQSRSKLHLDVIHPGKKIVPLATLILGRDVALSLSAFYWRYSTLPPPVSSCSAIGISKLKHEKEIICAILGLFYTFSRSQTYHSQQIQYISAAGINGCHYNIAFVAFGYCHSIDGFTVSLFFSWTVFLALNKDIFTLKDGLLPAQQFGLVCLIYQVLVQEQFLRNKLYFVFISHGKHYLIDWSFR